MIFHPVDSGFCSSISIFHLKKIYMSTEILSKIAIGRNSLSEIIDDIAKKIDPETILLISASYDYQLTENIFTKNPRKELKKSHYSLLILGIQEKSAISVKSMQSYISRLPNPPDLQLFFMDIHDFNKKLDNGDQYASEIALKAMVWYDKGEIPLHIPNINIDL